MTNTQLKVEDIFGDIINKNTVNQAQIFKLINFLAKMM